MLSNSLPTYFCIQSLFAHNTIYHDVWRTHYLRPQAEKKTQGDLGKAVGTSGDIISKYERDEIKPSIGTAAKIADALGVTLDYLVKEGKYQNIDNDALKLLKQLEKLTRRQATYFRLDGCLFCKI